MYANLTELHPTYQLEQHSIKLIWKDAASASKGVSLHSKKKPQQKKTVRRMYYQLYLMWKRKRPRPKALGLQWYLGEDNQTCCQRFVIFSGVMPWLLMLTPPLITAPPPRIIITNYFLRSKSKSQKCIPGISQRWKNEIGWYFVFASLICLFPCSLRQKHTTLMKVLGGRNRTRPEGRNRTQTCQNMTQSPHRYLTGLRCHPNLTCMHTFSQTD